MPAPLNPKSSAPPVSTSMRANLLIVYVSVASLLGQLSNSAEAQVLSLQLDASPREEGLSLVREGVSPARINIEGKDYEAWKSGHGSVPMDEWARSFLIKVTDPRFRDGKMPMVDVEIVYCHEGNTKVEVKADAGEGEKLAASGWGNEKRWKTLTFRLNDAYFGSRKTEADLKSLPVSGYDLRINAWAGDFHLRSVKLTGYDLDNNPDFGQLLTLAGAKTEDGNFIASGGKPKSVSWEVRNLARKAAAGTWQWRILDGEGKVAREATGPARLAPEKASSVTAQVPTQGLAPGFYALQFRLYPENNLATRPWLEDQRELVVAGSYDAFILFDPEPLRQGMDFLRRNTAAQNIPQGSRSVAAWAALPGSCDEFGWGRSWFVRLDNPEFRNGAQPAVDVEIVYRQESNAPVNVVVDTAEGPRQVATGWGNNPGFQTLRFSLNDAHFAGRVPPPKGAPAEEAGYDFRINGFNSDLALRSIRVRGYDLKASPDWKRLIVLEDISAGRPIFALPRGETDAIGYRFRNMALKPVEMECTFDLTDPDGKSLGRSTERLKLEPRTAGTLKFPVKTEGRDYGVYTIDAAVVARDGDRAEPLYTRTTRFAVHSPGVPAKAKDGEFFYGLDVVQGAPYDHPAFLEWTRVLGADILRNGGPAITDFEGMDRALELYKRYDVRTMMMPEPRYHPDPAQRRAQEQQLAKEAEAFAARYKDRVTYYELGNEPDLTFFYPGPIEAYIEGFETLYDGIKRGNPKARVMNGGLAFFGEDGIRRSRTFVEKVNPKKIDILAYHAHGPGAQAEREAYERILAVAKGAGKADKPFVDTESGFSAKTLRQERVQARTAVQKLVYAQSIGSPMFFWFRLFMSGSEEGYSSLKTPVEPRPVILSYRTTVELLRGHRFDRLFDFKQPGMEGYLFSKPSGSEHVLVAWGGDETASYHTLQFGGMERGSPGVEAADLFGNRVVHKVSPDGIASFKIGGDPLFLSWKGAKGGPRLVPPLVDAAAMVYVLADRETPVSVTVRNPGSSSLKGELEYSILGTELKGSVPVDLAAKGSATVTPQLRLEQPGSAVDWPSNWMVFTGFKEGDIDPSAFRSVPDSIPLGGKALAGRLLALRESTLNIGALEGGPRERAAALLLAEVESPADQTVELGASADWWMACYLNGEKVLDTLARGNEGGFSVDDHVFKARLRKGKNLVAFLVLSGSQGWKLLTAGPSELARERQGAGTAQEVSWRLKQGDSVLATQVSSLRFVHSLEELASPLAAEPAASWKQRPGASLLDATGVRNFFEAFPDSSRWFQGEADLSGSIWMGLDPSGLVFAVEVRDQEDVVAGSESEFAKSDSLDLALRLPKGVSSFRVGRIAGKTVVKPLSGPDVKAQAQVDRLSDGRTLYRVSVPRSQVPAGTVMVNARINDAEGGELKQTLTWRPGWSPEAPDTRLWFPLVIPAASR